MFAMDTGERALIRLTYELQDIADIFPGHRDSGDVNPSWTTASRVSILFDDPVLDMNTCERDFGSGGLLARGCRAACAFTTSCARPAMSTGSRAAAPATPARTGSGEPTVPAPATSSIRAPEDSSPTKHWSTPGYGRCTANEIAAACADGGDADSYFYQHDYFARRYERPASAIRGRGRWLPRGWHRPEAGGFDGRWVQLFDDPPAGPRVVPLRRCHLRWPGRPCRRVAHRPVRSRLTVRRRHRSYRRCEQRWRRHHARRTARAAARPWRRAHAGLRAGRFVRSTRLAWTAHDPSRRDRDHADHRRRRIHRRRDRARQHPYLADVDGAHHRRRGDHSRPHPSGPQPSWARPRAT